MSAKDRQPPTRPWCWNTLERLESDAWRSRAINTVRFIEFLEREDMRKGGAQNGNLKAPFKQLRAWGIADRFISGAIEHAITLGLVDAKQPGERIMSTYALTWLPLHDGTPASNRWKTYRNPDLAPLNLPYKGKADSKSKNLPYKGKAALPYKGKADSPNLPYKGKADSPKNLPYKGKVLLREDLTAGVFNQGHAAAAPTAAAPVAPAAAEPGPCAVSSTVAPEARQPQVPTLRVDEFPPQRLSRPWENR